MTKQSVDPLVAALFEKVQAPLFLIDKAGSILAANTQACIRVGTILPEDMAGKDIFSLIHFNGTAGPPDPVEMLRQRLQTAAIEGMRLRSTRGEEVDITPVPPAPGSKSTRFLVQVTVSSFVGSKSSFLAHMSHEMRTPLNTIIGMTDLSLREGQKIDHRKVLQTVKRASTSLLAVINDILDYSKIEAGKLTLEQIDFDLREILGTSAKTQSYLANKKGLELSLDVDEDVPFFLRGDPNRFRQVLDNLLTNAIKFTLAGTITVHVSAKIINGTQARTCLLKVSVSDTGIGISDDKQQDIFKSFQQADDTITRRFGGTGLGLSISQNLARLMGGDLTLSSSLGEGSTFTFTSRFQLSDSTMVDQRRKRDALSNLRYLPGTVQPGRTILLVEDNKLNRDLASIFLRSKGNKVITAYNGAEALDVLSKQDVDIVLMDIQMPIMDGVSATRAIREGRSNIRNPRVPIIAMTAFALKGDRQKFLKDGMDDYISKPIDLDHLLASINALLQQGEPVEQQDESPSPENSSSSLLFDQEGALALLRDNLSLLEYLCGIFMNRTPDDIKNLQRLIEEDNFDEARIQAHALKGASASVGAKRFSNVAQALEQALKLRESSSLQHLMESLDMVYHKTTKEMEQQLGNALKH